ncbi:MAG: alanine racemase [Bacteroidota bacterium]
MQRPSRPTVATIRLPNLASNLRLIQRRVGRGVGIMAVVKANAYGHGMVPVSRYLEDHGITAFGVAFAEEGATLRAEGIRSSILVFALSHDAQADLCIRHRLEPTVATADSIRSLQRAAERRRCTVNVHLKIDTGMNRVGIRPDDVPAILRELARARRLQVKGVYTHFATADEPDSPFAREQIARFDRAVESVIKAGVEPEVVHAANSGAILHQPDAVYSIVRAGILMYGYSPSGPDDRTLAVRPALTWTTRVAMVKRIAAGESVSYGQRFRADRSTIIATIPVGYADGLFRSLTGRGAGVLIHGRRFPIVGTICMDQCMVDCGEEDVRRGDEVVLIGRSKTESITAWDMAKIAGTIPYEVTCAISARVPRAYQS